jgi:hypothetical protein
MSVLKRVAAALALLVAGSAALFGANSAAAAPAYVHTPHITCQARVVEHTTITCHGDGYFAHKKIVFTLHSKTYALGSATSDANGDVTLTKAGLPAGVTGTHTVIGTDAAIPTDKASTTTLIVTSNSSGVGGVGAGTGSGTTASGSSGTGGLSSTGVAVVGLGVVGLALVGGGALLMISGRRRRASAA